MPVSVFAYSGTGNAQAYEGEYYKYDLLTYFGPSTTSGAVYFDGTITAEITTAAIGDSIDVNQQFETNGYGKIANASSALNGKFAYTKTVYSFYSFMTESSESEYDAKDTIAKSSVTLSALYTRLDLTNASIYLSANTISSANQLKASDDWYVVNLEGFIYNGGTDPAEVPLDGTIEISAKKKDAAASTTDGSLNVDVKDYDLTGTVNETSYGSIEFKNSNGVAEKVRNSEEITVIVSPKIGYKIASITSNGATTITASGSAAANKDNIYSFIGTKAGIAISVDFEEDRHNITVGAVSGGNIDVRETALTGDEVSIDVTPNAGYYLEGITVSYNDGGIKKATMLSDTAFKMPEFDVTVEASFVELTDTMINLNDRLGNGTKVGYTLGTGAYYLSGDLTLDGSNSGNGLKIADGATVVIYLNGYTLSATGMDAESGIDGKDGYNAPKGVTGGARMSQQPTTYKTARGGFAGILLPGDSKLIFVGSGEVAAQGGAGGAGGDGGDGGHAGKTAAGHRLVNDDDFGYAGGGAANGTGGGGAGAGIGTNGTASVSYGITDNNAAAAGTVIFYQDDVNSIKTNDIKGGESGNNGNSGDKGTSWYHSIGIYPKDDACISGGGGGGGLGAGGSTGAAIGQGGKGGQAGQRGESGVFSASYNAGTDYNGATGAGGTKGAAGTETETHVEALKYVIQALTVESKFSTLYKNDATEADLVDDRTTDDAIDVWAQYFRQGYSGYSNDTALNGGYDNLATCRSIELRTLKVDTGEDYNMYYTTVSWINTTGANVKATYIPFHYTTTTSSITGSVDVALGTNKAKDANNVEVGNGDAARYDDGQSGLDVQKTTSGAVSGAAFVVKKYENKDYQFESASGSAYSLGKMDYPENKGYTVLYTPYNDYLYAENEIVTVENGKYLLGSETTTGSYVALKAVRFHEAGLYTIIESETRTDDRLLDPNDIDYFEKVYYVVIEQADLEIKNAIVTVSDNTTVQNHTFDRVVIGQNGEEILGQYTFASNNATSTVPTLCDRENWIRSNEQNLTAGEDTPDITGLSWEFNIKHTGNTTSVASNYENSRQNPFGNRNMNNYLDQNDGAKGSEYNRSGKTSGGLAIGSGASIVADQNTYYHGFNGEIHYSADGVTVLKNNESLRVLGKYQDQQAFDANGTGIDREPTAFSELTTREIASGSTINSVFAENVVFGAEFYNEAYGFRVNEGDAVTGLAAGGTKITSVPESIKVANAAGATGAAVETISGSALYNKLVSNSALYKGDYYVVTIADKNGNLVKAWEYNDTDTVSPTNTNVPTKSAFELNVDNDWDALRAGNYTVTINYVGLYYSNNTGVAGRGADWKGNESFNWVTASQSFTLSVVKRNIAFKNLSDLYKVYDGTDILVKDTMNGGDVQQADAYIITLTDELATTETQFSKGLKNATNAAATLDAMYNYLQPLDGDYAGYHTQFLLEIAGTYASKNAIGVNDVDVDNERILDVDASHHDTDNYNLVFVNNQIAKGEIFTAQMYPEHNMSSKVMVYDKTPMRDALGLSVKASMPDVKLAYTTSSGYLATAVTFSAKELVNKDDKTKNASNPTNDAVDFDYDASYRLVEDSWSKDYLKRTSASAFGESTVGLSIDEETGEVLSVAEITSNNTSVDDYLRVVITLKEYGNYVVVKQAETAGVYNPVQYGECTESTNKNGNRNTTIYDNYYDVKDSNVKVGTGAYSDATLTHNSIYYIAGNSETINLILPINQVCTTTDCSFENNAGTQKDINVNTEKYKYVTVYQNGDSADFNLVCKQDQYLKDVYIIALPAQPTKFGNMPKYADISTTTNVVGHFTANTDGTICETVGSSVCALKLELVKVNGIAVPSDAALMNGTRAAGTQGYSKTALATPEEQVYGSKYTFRFTTGETNLGTGYNMVIVPVFGTVTDKDLISATPTLSVDSATGVSIKYVTTQETSPADETNTVGVAVLSYTDPNGATQTITYPLNGTAKNVMETLTIDTEADTTAAAFFNKKLLIPGVKVTATLKLWRNGGQPGFQTGTADDDFAENVSFTWTVSKADYYNLFKDEVVVLRSSNSTQNLDNVYGYGIASPASAMKFDDVYFVSNKNVSTVEQHKNLLTAYSTTWYAIGTTTPALTINDSPKTVSTLTLGDQIYSSVDKQEADNTNNNNNNNNNTPSSTPTGSPSVAPKQEHEIELPTTMPDGGKFTVSPEKAKSGDEVTITVTPDDGKEVDYIIVTMDDGTQIPVKTVMKDGKYTFTMPDGAVKIDVKFKDAEEETGVNIPKNIPGGDVDFTPADPKPGDEVTLKVTPRPGYELEEIIVRKPDGTVIKLTPVKDGEEYKFIMPEGAVEVEAKFKQNDNLDTPAQKPNGGDFTISPAAPKVGDEVTITPIPEEGYELGLLVITKEDGTEITVTPDENGNYKFTMPEGKVKIQIKFALKNFPFTDVAITDYYYDAVAWAYKNGITYGKDATHLDPKGISTRAEMVAFLWRAAGSPVVKGEMAFKDVDKDDYFYNAVLWGVQNGYVFGTSETTFSPDAVVTRAQSIAFIARMDGVKDNDKASENQFKDVKTTDYYNNAVTWAAENGITSGTSATTFSPNNNCVRCDLLCFLYNYFN